MNVKELGEQPAFPAAGGDSSGLHPAYGLTKREYFAAMALQGLLACSAVALDSKDLYARFSLEAADALLKALAKEDSQ